MRSWKIILGDALSVLKTLDDESIQCCVTSPPYWGVRDYKTDGQLGLEITPDQYVDRMVEVFREVRRVLRGDGTLWMNMGDCYAHGLTGGGSVFDNGRNDGRASYESDAVRGREAFRTLGPGLKVKDLVGIPWMLAFALRGDGWFLRSDIIWHKPNPMPESVTDRPTKSHEYLFLLSKSERYFYDADAIREDCIEGYRVNPNAEPMAGRMAASTAMWRNAGDRTTQVERGHDQTESTRDLDWKRNKRSVWTVSTQPFPEAHFATFPEALIVPCILAGSDEAGVVLDPFAGSGTTGVVALRYGRSFVGIELNPEYSAMAERRITDDAPLFNVRARPLQTIASEGL